MARDRLPDRRRAVSFEFVHVTPTLGRIAYRATLGYYDDGRLGEVFLASAIKVGTDTDVAIKDAAILLSFALQHGVTAEDARVAMTRSADGAPEGVMGTLLDLLAKEPPMPSRDRPEAA